MANVYLDVPFKEKDHAKSLGARFDSQSRQWYVPEGRDVSPFSAWLPAAAAAGPTSRSVAKATSTALKPSAKGIPLSQLLGGVGAAIAQAYKAGVWTTAEVLRASPARDGHVYLELSERDADGRVVAKTQAAIWASTAAKIIPEFERATGAVICPGIKLLLRARPVFKNLPAPTWPSRPTNDLAWRGLQIKPIPPSDSIKPSQCFLRPLSRRRKRFTFPQLALM